MIPLDSLFAAIGHTLWAVSWQVCILAAIALIAERIFRNAPPGFRYWLWMLVVIRLAVPFDIPLPSPAGDYVNLHIPLYFSPIDTGTVQPSLSVPHQTAVPIDPFRVAGLLWLLGFVSFMLYLEARLIKTRRLLSKTEPITRPDLLNLMVKYSSDLDIKKKIGLLTSNDESFSAPAVFGVIKPRIILPHEIVSVWPVEDIEPLLLHEMIHIKRRDLLINWFQIMVHAIYFFHPVFWLANSRIRKSREEICDDLSVSLLKAEPERYSLTMVRIGEVFLNERTEAFAEVGFSERGSSLGGRIRRIMRDDYTPHKRLTVLSLITLFAIAVFGIMLACNRTAVKEGNENGGKEANAAKVLNHDNIIYLPNRKNIIVGSERVIMNGETLSRMTDYTIDYNTGELAILNKKAMDPESIIEISCGMKNLNNSKQSGNIKPPSMELITGPYLWNPDTKRFEISYRIMGGPQSSQDQKLAPMGLKITILGSSNFDVGKEPVSPSDLEQVIREQLPSNLNDIIIYGYSETPVETIRFVTDLAKNIGVRYIRWSPLINQQMDIIMNSNAEKSSKADTNSSQLPIENKVEQPQQNKRSDIQIILLENGEYDIAGTHATDKTFEKVLKTELGTYPEDYRRLFISGTPKNMSQLDLATTIARKLKAAVAVKLDNPEKFVEAPTNTSAGTSSPADEFRRKAAQQKKEGSSSTSGNQLVISVPTKDPRVFISYFQRVLKDTDAPLSDEQQKKMSEVFDPRFPNDMRSVYGILAKEQKQILVNILRKQLEKSAYPLTKSQEARIMALGRGSKDKSESDIVTPEQAKISIQSEMNSRQIPNEKKSEQPQQDKRSNIYITILENGEYDIEGIHATDETIKQVLKSIIDKSPMNKRNVIISGTPKSSEELFKVQNIAVKLNTNISIDPEVMKALDKQIHLTKPIGDKWEIYVNIIKKGEYEVDGKKAKDENFLQVLKQELAKNPGRRVTFVSSTGATIDNIYELRDLAEKNGIHISVSIDFHYPTQK